MIVKTICTHAVYCVTADDDASGGSSGSGWKMGRHKCACFSCIPVKIHFITLKNKTESPIWLIDWLGHSEYSPPGYAFHLNQPNRQTGRQAADLQRLFLYWFTLISVLGSCRLHASISWTKTIRAHLIIIKADAKVAQNYDETHTNTPWRLRNIIFLPLSSVWIEVECADDDRKTSNASQWFRKKAWLSQKWLEKRKDKNWQMTDLSKKVINFGERMGNRGWGGKMKKAPSLPKTLQSCISGL